MYIFHRPKLRRLAYSETSFHFARLCWEKRLYNREIVDKFRGVGAREFNSKILQVDAQKAASNDGRAKPTVYTVRRYNILFARRQKSPEESSHFF